MKSCMAVLLPVVIISGFLATCSNKRPLVADWMVVTKSSAQEVYMTDGVVTPGRLLSLSFMKNGIVMKSAIDEGRPVNAGDTLARLDNTEESNMVAQRRVDVAIARVSLEQLTTTSLAVAKQKLVQAQILEAADRKKVAQAEAMMSQGSITQAALDDVHKTYAIAVSQRIIAESEYNAILITEPQLQQSHLQQAEILLNDALNTLSQTIVVAPSAGKIVARHYATGEMYISGTPILTFLSVDSVISVLVDVSPSAVMNIRTGQQAIVHCSDTALPAMDAVVAMISPRVDSTTGKVKVTLESPANAVPLLTNAKVPVEIFIDTISDALVLEKKFVHVESSGGSVFIKNGDRAEKRSVTYYFSTGSRYIIREGLNAGDTAVAAKLLDNGMSLRLAKKQTQ
jgi:multidrug efflux pump subunit AcrA (membrane-fusion protein)